MGQLLQPPHPTSQFLGLSLFPLTGLWFHLSPGGPAGSSGDPLSTQSWELPEVHTLLDCTLGWLQARLESSRAGGKGSQPKAGTYHQPRQGQASEGCSHHLWSHRCLDPARSCSHWLGAILVLEHPSGTRGRMWRGISETTQRAVMSKGSSTSMVGMVTRAPKC